MRAGSLTRTCACSSHARSSGARAPPKSACVSASSACAYSACASAKGTPGCSPLAVAAQPRDLPRPGIGHPVDGSRRQFSTSLRVLGFGAAITSADFPLQIGVRPGASTGAFTTLSPTTNIRMTPQAQAAGIATEAATVSANVITSASIANGSVGSADINNAQVQARVTGTASADVNTAQVQARVTGTCPAGSSINAIAANGTVTCETDDTGWSLTGNTGTNPATNFLGTDLELGLDAGCWEKGREFPILTIPRHPERCAARFRPSESRSEAHQSGALRSRHRHWRPAANAHQSLIPRDRTTRVENMPRAA